MGDRHALDVDASSGALAGGNRRLGVGCGLWIGGRFTDTLDPAAIGFVTGGNERRAAVVIEDLRGFGSKMVCPVAGNAFAHELGLVLFVRLPAGTTGKRKNPPGRIGPARIQAHCH